MRRWAGLDLNGWLDHAATGWDVEEEADLGEEVRLISGGVGAAVIDRAVERTEGRFVGGPQAILAPHGRGVGWGTIGDPTRRRPIRGLLRDLVDGKREAAGHIAAAVAALTPGAERLMLTIPDHEAYAEAVQGRFLAALKSRRVVKSQLLWRPVALLHGVRDGGLLPTRPGLKFRLLLHAEDGVEMQTLTLGEAVGFPGHVAPVRDGFGRLIWPELGLGPILEKAERQVDDAQTATDDQGLEPSRLAVKLITGDAKSGDLEILRRSNGNWLQVKAPYLDPASLLPAALDSIQHEPADATIFVTPLCDELAVRVERLIAFRLPEVLRGGTELVARGALAAGRLIERGLPHYLDRLEPIALAVLGRDAARFELLTPGDKHVPADREFVSQPMTGFVWGRGRDRLEIYVLKGEHEVRKWVASVENGPPRDVPVTLQLRQTPGQSWAKLTIASTEWDLLARSPIRLAWEVLEPDPRTPSEVLEELEPKRPVVPNRVVEPAHLGFWDGSLMQPGLSDLLASDAETLYRALRQTRRDFFGENGVADGPRARLHPVGTDGDLPANLPKVEAELLKMRIEEMAYSLDRRIMAGDTIPDNRPFLCLTWCFTLCPQSLQDHILDAMEAYERSPAMHPLLTMQRSQTVLQQGAGRAVSGEDRVSRLLRSLAIRNPWNNDTIGALSFVLSRRREAPSALANGLVEIFALRLCDKLREINDGRSYRQTFKYVLEALTGLVRRREIEPYAVVAGRDELALKITRQLRRAAEGLDASSSDIPQAWQKRVIVEGLIELLSGEGGDPDLLRRIDMLSEK